MELKGLSAEKWTWTGIVCAYDFFVSDIYIYPRCNQLEF